MLDKLQHIEDNYNELKEKIMNPNIAADNKEMIRVSKELSRLEEVYQLIQTYKKYQIQLTEAKEIINDTKDEDMITMAKEERYEAEEKIKDLEEKLKIALLPTDTNDDKNIFLEIRPAAWWDEAWLFAAELLKMYLWYAQNRSRKAEIVEETYNDVWWLKFAMVKISGDSVYSFLKFESGVHRVQRIPATESQGRVHTSTVTVAIMPEVEDVDFHLDPAEVEMDTLAASSAGGQNANKNQTGVRLRHIPTGTIVLIADSKSQIQNKQKARDILKARLYQEELDKQIKEQKDLRGNQIGTGDRSEKIRTYNFPQDRVTDHRIKESWSNIPVILTWDIQDIIDKTILENQTKLLEKAGE